MQEIPPPVAADGDPGHEIGEDDESHGDIQPLDGVHAHARSGQERGQDDEQDRDDVEDDDAVTEAMGLGTVALIEMPQGPDQPAHEGPSGGGGVENAGLVCGGIARFDLTGPNTSIFRRRGHKVRPSPGWIATLPGPSQPARMPDAESADLRHGRYADPQRSRPPQGLRQDPRAGRHRDRRGYLSLHDHRAHERRHLREPPAAPHRRGARGVRRTQGGDLPGDGFRPQAPRRTGPPPGLGGCQGRPARPS